MNLKLAGLVMSWATALLLLWPLHVSVYERMYGNRGTSKVQAQIYSILPSMLLKHLSLKQQKCQDSRRDRSYSLLPPNTIIFPGKCNFRNYIALGGGKASSLRSRSAQASNGGLQPQPGFFPIRTRKPENSSRSDTENVSG